MVHSKSYKGNLLSTSRGVISVINLSRKLVPILGSAFIFPTKIFSEGCGGSLCPDGVMTIKKMGAVVHKRLNPGSRITREPGTARINEKSIGAGTLVYLTVDSSVS